MASSCRISTMRVVTSILLFLSIAQGFAIPQRQLSAHGVLAARAPVPESEDSEAQDARVTIDAKKDGDNFFKDLGNFLSGFDPLKILRDIIGGVLGFGNETTTSTTSLSPSSTVVIKLTPVNVKTLIPVSLIDPLSLLHDIVTTKRTTTTVTKQVTTTQTPGTLAPSARVSSTRASSTQASSTRASSTRVSTTRAGSSGKVSASTSAANPGDVSAAVPVFPSVETLDLGGLLPSVVFTPHHIIFTPPSSVNVSARAATSKGPEQPIGGPISSIPDLVEATTTSSLNDIFSILPFIVPGEHLSDNVTWPSSIPEVTITEVLDLATPTIEAPEATDTDASDVSIPDLPIPIFTGPSEPLDAFGEESTGFPTSGLTQERIPLKTETGDLDTAPVPLLEFVNGTYVLPTTKEPDFVTPIVPPPSEIPTAKPGITYPGLPPILAGPSIEPLIENASPRKSSLLEKTSLAKGPRTTGLGILPTPPLLPTKPILLPPPLIRPTDFPLNETFFANQTRQSTSSFQTSTRPQIFANTLLNEFDAASPIAKGVRPGVRPTPPLILPNPLLPTIPPVPLPSPIENSSIYRNITRRPLPLILTNPLRPTIEPVPLPEPLSNPDIISTPLVNPLHPTVEPFPPFSNGTEKPTYTSRRLPLIQPIRPTYGLLRPEPLIGGKSPSAAPTQSRSAGFVTVVVVPTPVDVSALGVDVPSDEPIPSGAAFEGPGLFPEAGDENENGDENEDENGDESENESGDENENEDIPLVTQPSVLSLAEPTEAPVETGTTLPEISLGLADGLGAPVVSPDVLPSLLAPLATPISSVEFNLEDIPTPIASDITFPLSVPTPTPRSFATPPTPNGPALPALPSGFPLPVPSLNTGALSPPKVRRLVNICSDPRVRIVSLPLLDKWFGPNAYPSLRSFPGCVTPNARQAIQAPGLLNCTELGQEVQACQAAGRRVLLTLTADLPATVNGSLRWGSANPGDLGLKLPLAIPPPGPFLGRPGHPFVPLRGNLSNITVGNDTVAAPNLFDAFRTPNGLAATLFSLFGEGHSERADLRPLGPDAPGVSSPDSIRWVAKPLGDEVVLDGFDVRVPGQWKGTPQDALVQRFVVALRELVNKAWDEEGEGDAADLGTQGPGIVVSAYI